MRPSEKVLKRKTGIARGARVLVLILVAACGRKGPPLPPESAVPRPIADLAVQSSEGGALLAWTAPDKNVDGSNLDDLRQFVLLRRRVALSAMDSLAEAAKLKVPEERERALQGILGESVFEEIFDVDYVVAPGGKRPKRMRAVDPSLPIGFLYEYDIRAVNAGGDRSLQSNIVHLPAPALPPAPTGLVVTPGDAVVGLKWSPVTGFSEAGTPIEPILYRVYRREDSVAAAAPFPDEPLTPDPIAITSYDDRQVQNEHRYAYVVHSVRLFRDVALEGPSSAQGYATPSDTTAPPAPTGLTAVTSAAGILLRWAESPAPDLLGYNVYRQTLGPGEREGYGKLTPSPVREPAFTDATADPRKSYRYVVTAVDRSPHQNESARSLPVEARR